jgi:hypothetical protein
MKKTILISAAVIIGIIVVSFVSFIAIQAVNGRSKKATNQAQVTVTPTGTTSANEKELDDDEKSLDDELKDMDNTFTEDNIATLEK